MLDDEKTVKWLLKHRVDEFGNINLCGLDFRSVVRRDVNFSNIKVSGDLYQNNQKVEGDLIQCCQLVEGNLNQECQIVDKNLYQSGQAVRGNLYQCLQSVKGGLISHKLIGGEHWEDYADSNCWNSVIRKRNLKSITREELKKMGYILKENKNEEEN